MCVCVCLSVSGGVGVWAKVVFPTGILCTCKSWLLWVSNGGMGRMACLSVHMYIGAGGVR